VSGTVAPQVGVALDAGGALVGANGTVPMTVTRHRRGHTVTVTIVPSS
jgi:hypothetical protein